MAGSVTSAGVEAERNEARVNLAAIYRLLEHFGWSDIIYNHATMRVPGRPTHFLIKRHDLLYTEVTASNLVEVDMNDDLDERSGVNRPGFVLHSGVLSARPEIACSIHVHTDIGVALAGLRHGLRQLSLHSARFYNRIGYHDFTGVNDSPEEQRKTIASLGQNRAMILRNHVLLTVGHSAREAFVLLRELIAAGRTQFLMESTGAELCEIPSDVCEVAAETSAVHDRGRGNADWPAYLRILDRIDPGYRL
jgi:ribulose-5-phosphate 4-epimerase/fuculose-1-phosphate aldolase